MAPRDRPFGCAVVRHRGARRMTLRVSRAGVRLTVPRAAGAAEVDRFLRASEGWIAEQQALLGPPPPPLADGDRVALLDEELELSVRGGARRSSVRREGGRLTVALAPAGDLDGIVERWYRREAASALEGRARAVAARLGVSVAAVAIRDPRSRWGSCASTGRLSFSWRLLLAPKAVADHVVAHEVCHLVRPDHSPAFWALVEEIAPGVRARRAWLREHGDRLHLGPAWRSVRRPAG
jgi:predicted metal-dependent hydrolase